MSVNPHGRIGHLNKGVMTYNIKLRRRHDPKKRLERDRTGNESLLENWYAATARKTRSPAVCVFLTLGTNTTLQDNQSSSFVSHVELFEELFFLNVQQRMHYKRKTL